jgi:hypothetical protein
MYTSWQYSLLKRYVVQDENCLFFPLFLSVVANVYESLFTTDPASKNMSAVTAGNKRPAEENSVRIRRNDMKEMIFLSIEINLVG